MEMHLAPFYGGIFDWISFLFVLGPSLTAAVFIWLNQRSFEKKGLGIEDLLQIWSRVALDSVIVMGICGTMIGIQGMIANNDASTLSTEQLYTTARIALLTLLRMGWCRCRSCLCYSRSDKKTETRLNGFGLGATILLMSYFIIDQCGQTGLSIESFFLLPTALLLYGGILLSSFGLALIKKDQKNPLIILIESNLTATLGGAALGICHWFMEGANYLESRDAIFLVANIIFMGCVGYLVIYYISLYLGQRHLGNFQIKTWHFAEAAAFFIFLVYAPVGTTEFMREASDQASLQDQHEAQQLEINQLKAQIKFLTEKVGEV